MTEQHDLISETRTALTARLEDPYRPRAFVGFDGFVDSISHMVAKRGGPGENFTRLETITDFAARVGEAAGKSTNIEYVEREVRLGGNGPLMARTMGALGVPLLYAGIVGAERAEPPFDVLEEYGRTVPLGPPAKTLACEFTDGKIMMNETTPLEVITPSRLEENFGGRSALADALGRSQLTALVNWTMTPHMTAIFKYLLEEVLPRVEWVGSGRALLFIDLADPQKRADEDLLEVLNLLREFAPYYHVILGLNLKESERVAGLFNGSGLEALSDRAAFILQELEIGDVIIHHSRGAAIASTESASREIKGPHTPKPKTTTGAGDNFNAGYAAGRALGLKPPQAMVFGMGTGGFYVRNARGANAADLLGFLESWRAGTFDQ